MASKQDIQNSENISKNADQIFTKANKIHLKLLSFVQNELNEKKKMEQNIFLFSEDKFEIKEDKNIKYLDRTEHKSNDTSFNSDDNESDEESSSDLSCSEDCIIDLGNF